METQTQKPAMKTVIKDIGKCYCENTTIHGFAYTIGNQTNCVEKLFWLIIVIIAFTCGSIIVHNSLTEWEMNPTVATIESFATPITDIQFPTVTVCVDQNYDRWGFTRTVLNTLKYQCDTFENESDSQHEEFKHDWYGEDIKILKAPEELENQEHMNILSGTCSEEVQRTRNLLDEAKFTDCSRYDDGEADQPYDMFFAFNDEPLPGDKTFFATAENNVDKIPICYKDNKIHLIILNEMLSNETKYQDRVNLVLKERLKGKKQVFKHTDYYMTYEWEQGDIDERNLPLKFLDFHCKKEKANSILKDNAQQETIVGNLGCIDTLIPKCLDGTFHCSPEHSDSCNDLKEKFKKAKLLNHKVAFLGGASTDLGSALEARGRQCIRARNGSKIHDDPLWHYYEQFGYTNINYIEDKRDHSHTSTKEVYPEALLRRLSDEQEYLKGIGTMDIPGLLAAFDFTFPLDTDLYPWPVSFPYAAKSTALLFLKDSNSEWAIKCPWTEDEEEFNSWVSKMKLVKWISCLMTQNYFGKRLNASLLIIMKVMRMSQVLGNSGFSSEDFNRVYPNYKEISGGFSLKVDFPLQSLFDNNESTQEMTAFKQDLQQLDLILSTIYKGKTTYSCGSMFMHVPTNNGICSSFNAEGFSGMFHDSAFTRAFKASYTTAGTSTKILNNAGSGSKYGLEMILDSHSRDIFKSKAATFKIGINTKENYFDLMTDELLIQPGRQTELAIRASKYNTHKSFQALDLETRKCRFDHETKSPNSMFKRYTEKACMFECAVVESEKACGCLPWDMPGIPGRDYEICTGYGTFCFQSFMSNISHSEKLCIGCEPSCNETKYDISMDVRSIDMNFMCKEIIHDLIKPYSLSPDKELAFRSSSYPYLTHYNFLKPSPETLLNVCTDVISKDLSKVTIRMAQPTIQVVQQKSRVSFVEKLAMLGGTVGLFTGMSLLSMVEAIFWLVKCVRGVAYVGKI